MKRVLVPLASGFEEIEAVTVIDVLRRAGVEVTVAGTDAGPIAGSRGIQLKPDRLLDDVKSKDFDMIVLPGGTKGVESLKQHPTLMPLLGEFTASGKLIGAICAAPSLLAAAGLLCGKQVTSHPSVKPQVAPASLYTEERVAVDGKIITSRGPGTAMEFALRIVEILVGPEKVSELKQAMLV
jgi:4-methyl-5(b-hydroxyethyl)-thiazole monophosphate biosynthesis